MSRSLGITTETLTPEEIKHRYPEINTADVVVGTWGPDDGPFDPHMIMWGYVNRAREMGVRLRQGVRATGIRVQKGRVTGVVTDEGFVATGVVVGYAAIASLRQRYPDTTELTIQQLGRELKADEVLYILIDDFDLHHDAAGGFYRPHVSGAAKVIEVAQGQHVWPETVTYRSFSFTGKLLQADDATFEDKLVSELAEQIAATLGPCFYEHEAERYPQDPV